MHTLPGLALPVLALPGLLNDERLWQHQARALGAHHPFMAVPSLGSDSVQGLAAAVLAKAPAEPFALIGFSLGGYVALEVMRQAPQRVRGLALVDTGARSDTPQATAMRQQAIAAMQEPAGARGVMEALLPRVVHPAHTGNQPLVDLLQAMAEAVGIGGFIRQQTAAMNRPDSRPSLALIRCPTLIVCGREDQTTPLELAHEMAAGIRGSQLVIVEECGHMAPLEQPAAVNAALLDWLRMLSSSDG